MRLNCSGKLSSSDQKLSFLTGWASTKPLPSGRISAWESSLTLCLAPRRSFTWCRRPVLAAPNGPGWKTSSNSTTAWRICGTLSTGKWQNWIWPKWPFPSEHRVILSSLLSVPASTCTHTLVSSTFEWLILVPRVFCYSSTSVPAQLRVKESFHPGGKEECHWRRCLIAIKDRKEEKKEGKCQCNQARIMYLHFSNQSENFGKTAIVNKVNSSTLWLSA